MMEQVITVDHFGEMVLKAHMIAVFLHKRVIPVPELMVSIFIGLSLSTACLVLNK